MTTTGGITASQLKSIIERVERVKAQKKELTEDEREIFAEAKGNGYDPKIIRAIITLRKMNPGDRAEQESLLETYMSALGMK